MSSIFCSSLSQPSITKGRTLSFGLKPLYAFPFPLLHSCWFPTLLIPYFLTCLTDEPHKVPAKTAPCSSVLQRAREAASISLGYPRRLVYTRVASLPASETQGRRVPGTPLVVRHLRRRTHPPRCTRINDTNLVGQNCWASKSKLERRITRIYRKRSWCKLLISSAKIMITMWFWLMRQFRPQRKRKKHTTVVVPRDKLMPDFWQGLEQIDMFQRSLSQARLCIQRLHKEQLGSLCNRSLLYAVTFLNCGLLGFANAWMELASSLIAYGARERDPELFM